MSSTRVLSPHREAFEVAFFVTKHCKHQAMLHRTASINSNQTASEFEGHNTLDVPSDVAKTS